MLNWMEGARRRQARRRYLNVLDRVAHYHFCTTCSATWGCHKRLCKTNSHVAYARAHRRWQKECQHCKWVAMRRKLELKSGTEYQLDFNENLAMSPEAFSRQYVSPAVARALETPLERYARVDAEATVLTVEMIRETVRVLREATAVHDQRVLIVPRDWIRDPDFEDVFGLAELGGDIGVIPS